MMICSKCLSVACECGSHSLVEIDDLIVEEIIELNKKGYRTLFCCEGHAKRTVFDMYVMFTEKFALNVPKPLKLDRNKMCVRYCKWSDKITQADIENARKVFKQWVHDLPPKTV